MADEARGEIPEPGNGHRMLARLHLEVLLRMVCEHAWDGGPSLAEISRLLPDDVREITYEQILAVLEELGVEPGVYFYELSLESTKRELEAAAYHWLQAARPWEPERNGPRQDEESH